MWYFGSHGEYVDREARVPGPGPGALAEYDPDGFRLLGGKQAGEIFRNNEVFNNKVAGCLVTEGVARRSAGVRLLRDNVVIHEGTLRP